MAEKLNQNQFAKLVGKSRQAISQLIKKEVIPLSKKNGKGVIDLSNKEVKAYMKSVKERTENIPKNIIPVLEVKPKKNKKGKSVNLPVEKNKDIELNSVLPEDDLPSDIIARLDSGQTLKTSEVVNMPKVWVEKIKLYEMTKQIKQKRQQERGELVSRKFIRVTLGKLFEIHINEFLTLKSKVIPDIAGVFGSTDDTKKLKAEKIIDSELWEVLKHIKSDFNKYLEKVKADAIE